MREGLPVSAIIVAQKIGWRRIPRKCFHDLLGQPLRRRIPVTANHSNCRRPCPRTIKANRRSNVRVGTTQIDCRNHIRMVAQEGSPILGWRSLPSDHVLGDRRLGECEPKLKQFAVDAAGRPTTGSPYSSAGSDRVARARFWASLTDLGISSANRPEILRDAIAGWYRVEQFEPNRAGLARAASSTPAGSGHSPS